MTYKGLSTAGGCADRDVTSDVTSVALRMSRIPLRRTIQDLGNGFGLNLEELLDSVVFEILDERRVKCPTLAWHLARHSHFHRNFLGLHSRIVQHNNGFLQRRFLNSTALAFCSFPLAAHSEWPPITAYDLHTVVFSVCTPMTERATGKANNLLESNATSHDSCTAWLDCP